MKLTESRLRNIIREELSKLNEEFEVKQNKEFIANVVSKAVDKLGLPLTRSDTRDFGQMEFSGNGMGFFVDGNVIDNGRIWRLKITGKGREYDDGTVVEVSNQGDRRDVQKVADVIEDEPLTPSRQSSMPGRGEVPRRDI